MIPTSPNPRDFVLPEEVKVMVFGANQPQYSPLTGLKTPEGMVATQWVPTREELELLIRGMPLTIVIHTYNQPLQPLSVGVGIKDLTTI